jgi:hypothetical protein
VIVPNLFTKREDHLSQIYKPLEPLFHPYTAAP